MLAIGELGRDEDLIARQFAAPGSLPDALLVGAVGTLLEAGARDGTLRTDVSRDDVLLAMSGIAQSTGQYGTREQAAHLTGLLMDSLTKGTAAAART
jgi:hypothetical protein